MRLYASFKVALGFIFIAQISSWTSGGLKKERLVFARIAKFLFFPPRTGLVKCSSGTSKEQKGSVVVI